MRYRFPLYAHLLRRGISPEQAEDWLQEFLVTKILQDDIVSRADPKRGRFRTFLLTALQRFVANQFRDEHAKKRHPATGRLVHLTDLACEPVSRSDSAAFDVDWARQLISEALERMERECATSNRQTLWMVFQWRVLDPMLQGLPPVDYCQLIARTGLSSPAEASNTLITAKRMYARILRDVVAEYANSGEEVESEIDDLQKTLARVCA